MTEARPKDPKEKADTGEILKKILEKNDCAKLFDQLVSLKGEDLQTILIALSEVRASKLKPNDILRHAMESRFIETSPVSQKDLILFDADAINVLPKEFEAIQLSPLGPLGTNAVLAGLNQKTMVTTARNSEVLGDASPMLAIEYAKRRKSGKEGQVDLFTSQRVVRAQNFSVKGFTPHFQALFAFSADKFLGRWELLEEFLEKHISYYLDLIKKANQSGRYEARNVKVSISNLMIMEALIEFYGINREELMLNTQTREFNVFKHYGIDLANNLNMVKEVSDDNLKRFGIEKAYKFLIRNCSMMISGLMNKYPEVSFDYDFNRIAGIGYYDHLCIKISAENEDNEIYPLADGGFVDWTRQLVQSDQEVCLTSGFGSELFINKFKKK